jgi:hypothetical protein
VVGLQRSAREWAMRQGWGGRTLDHKAAASILIAGRGMLAAHAGYCSAATDIRALYALRVIRNRFDSVLLHT